MIKLFLKDIKGVSFFANRELEDPSLDLASARFTAALRKNLNCFTFKEKLVCTYKRC
jgi:hypothetical protein